MGARLSSTLTPAPSRVRSSAREFLDAVSEGDPRACDRLGGIDINCTDFMGKTALHLAAQRGHVALCESLIARGIDLEALDDYGATALGLSISRAKCETCAVLLRAGARVDRVNVRKRVCEFQDALSLALFWGIRDERVLELLWDHCAHRTDNVHRFRKFDSSGRCPLHYAAERYDSRLWSLVLRRGVDLACCHPDGPSILETAMVRNRDDAVISSIMETLGGITTSSDVPLSDSQLQIKAEIDFLMAALRGRVEQCRAMVQSGKKGCGGRDLVCSRTADGWTALHVVMCRPNADPSGVFRELVDLGVDINAVDRHGRSPLFRATQMCDIDVCFSLVRLGATVWPCRDALGMTLLHALARRMFFVYIDTALRLRQYMGDIMQAAASARAELLEARDALGMTALHVAVGEGNDLVYQWLVAHGADVGAVDAQGRTVLQLAMMSSTSEAEMFISQFVNAREQSAPFVVHSYLFETDARRMQWALSAGVSSVSKRSWLGFTRLHYTAGCGMRDMCALLIAHGADVNARTAAGETPLDLAICRGHPGVCTLLVGCGATRSEQDPLPVRVRAYERSSSVSPQTLFEAAACGDERLCKLLLASGHSPNVLDTPVKLGDTSSGVSRMPALGYAIRAGMTGVAHVLLAAGAERVIVGYSRLLWCSLPDTVRCGQVNMAREFCARPMLSGMPCDVVTSILHLTRDAFNHLIRNPDVGDAVVAGMYEVLRPVFLSSVFDVEFAGMLAVASRRSLPLIETLLSCVNHSAYTHGPTMLHVAAEHGRADVVRFVLERGLYDVRRRQEDGMTATQVAIHYGHVMVSALLEMEWWL